jgi:hypothetical protein
MKRKPVLICKSNMTYLPTSLPVYFYGMPDDRIYLIYSRFYDINFYKSGMEFVIAHHEDFSFDYESGQIITSHFGKIDVDGFIEMIDRPDQRIKILKVHRNLDSYADALGLLKIMAPKSPRLAEISF